ncbi:hypothetical protein A9Q84_02320 [Halobacteriovorax marinus]|uniref:NADH-quinone oxidoreductase subunit D n=1 Tax=Halobacteriovorax marinus TaxID=97084 RepID=A0A1Y5FI67_9BACT|nr:hypothetical protein A9Q84_02320 [Halobacteriovorax marinus]
MVTPNSFLNYYSGKLNVIDDSNAELILEPNEDIKGIFKKLKEEFGFIMLIDIFGLDLLKKKSFDPQNERRFQVVYILLNMEMHLRLRVVVNVDVEKNEVLPSCRDLWAAAHWCEREIWEMFGISFGTESEKRLLSVSGLKGFPFRKDFSFNGLDESLDSEESIFENITDVPKYKLNLVDSFSIGPIHPALKGSMKLHLQIEGDGILNSQLEVGYLHRSIEKLCEEKLYTQIIPLTDRLNFFSAASNNIGWCKAVEDLVNIEISDKAKAMRMVASELARVSDHTQCIGSIARAVGMFEPIQLSISIKEIVSSLFERLCGSRFNSSISRIGGMSVEVPSGWVNDCLTTLKVISKKVDEIDTHLTRSTLWIERLRTTTLNAYDAIDLGITGPNLRACGVNYDIRKVSPYYFYEDVEFEIPLGINGDCYDRYLVRIEEIRQSLKIISQVLDSLPLGKMCVDKLKTELDLNPLNFAPNLCEGYSMTETPNGELGFFISSDGENRPYRVKIKGPSFFSAQAFSSMLENTKVNDAMISLCSMNIVAGEVDR